MRLMLIAALVAATGGCASKAETTKPATYIPAQIIREPVPFYVSIDKSLTQRCKWPRTDRLSMVIESDRKKGECLEQYERQFDAIDSLQGTAAPEAIK